jgi:hypothetical protein
LSTFDALFDRIENRTRFMKKVVALCGLLLAAVTLTKAQSPASVVAHSRDFFVVQLSYDMWAGAPDSVQTGGISRGFNFAFMYDFPFKEGSHLSVAPGLGISTSSVFFSDQAPQIGGTAPTLAFPSDSIYKHYKLTTAHLEIPVELRYRQYADNANKGLKVGLGLKFGTLLSAHTKGKKIVGGSKQVQFFGVHGLQPDSAFGEVRRSDD